MATVELKVPDIGDFKEVEIIEVLVKPGDSIEHLKWAGKYAVEQKPDVIVHIGDH